MPEQFYPLCVSCYAIAPVTRRQGNVFVSIGYAPLDFFYCSSLHIIPFLRLFFNALINFPLIFIFLVKKDLKKVNMYVCDLSNTPCYDISKVVKFFLHIQEKSLFFITTFSRKKHPQAKSEGHFSMLKESIHIL